MNRFLLYRILVIAMGAWGCQTASLIAAKDLYVATNAIPSSPYDSWSTAHTDIQDALNDAAEGDTIYLAGHSFMVTNGIVWSSSVNLTIRGGYAATNDVDLPGDRDLTRWPSVITPSPGSSLTLITVDATTNARLDGVVVQGGARGMTILNNSSFWISECMIVSNTLSGDGGGLYMANSSVVISNSALIGNRAVHAAWNSGRTGGALYLASGNVTVRNSVFAYNFCSAGSGARGRGGAIWNNGQLTLKNCLFYGNMAHNTHNWSRREGDVVYLNDGSVTILNCTVADNGLVDAIYRAGGSVAVTNSIFWGNGPTNMVGANISLGYNSIETGEGVDYAGNGSIDPGFEYGYYLPADSLLVNAGTNTAAAWGLNGFTTLADGQTDDGIVNLGYHYQEGYDFDWRYLYVDVSGNDGNNGQSSGTPLRTIGKALALARDGSRIHIGSGVYGPDTETFPLCLLARTDVKLIGQGEGNTIIDGEQIVSNLVWMSCLTRCSMEGMTLRNGYVNTQQSNERGAGLQLDRVFGMNIIDSRFYNNSIRGHTSIGGGIHQSLTRLRIEGSLFDHNQATHWTWSSGARGGAIGVGTGVLTIERCVFRDQYVSGRGAGAYGGAVYMWNTHAHFRNSLFHSNRVTSLDYADRFGGDAIYSELGSDMSSAGLEIENCTLAGHPSEALHRVNAAIPISIKNSILAHNMADVFNVPTNVFHHSNVNTHTNANGLHLFVFDGSQNNINVDPLFIDAAEGDYRLQRGRSPCIDTGKNLDWMPDAIDVDGYPRILYGTRSKTVDMGAYETHPLPGSFFATH